jgi:hypothetical protein
VEEELKRMSILFSIFCLGGSRALANPTSELVLTPEENSKSNSDAMSYNDGTSIPKYTLGVGLGSIHFLHVDYSRWKTDSLSLDVSLTPYLLLNVCTVGVTNHISLTENTNTEHNLLISGGIIGIDGFLSPPAFGPNGRIGYEWLGKNIGLRGYLGGLVLFTSKQDIEFGPDVRFSLMYVKR